MANDINYCRTCALADPRSSVCQLTGRRVEPDKDYCSSHVTRAQLGECAYCHQLFIGPGYLEQLEDGSWIEFCHSCADKFGTCQMCSRCGNCGLTDESVHPELPVVVFKTVQRGPATMRAQVVNPDRIEKICKCECECWDGEGCARRDFNTCAKYNQKTVN